MRPTLLLLFMSLSLAAQPISIGVKAGLPLTQAFETIANPFLPVRSDTRRYTVGPSIEVRLPARLSIELDALYKRFNFSTVRPLGGAATNSEANGDSWEFPLMLKYRFKGGIVRPFIDGGVSFNSLAGLTGLRRFFIETSSTNAFGSGRRTGLVVGGGLEARIPFLRISPEVRWTRWGWDNFRDVGGVLRANDNQAEFLVGVSF